MIIPNNFQLSPQRQAAVYSGALTLTFTLGVLALITLVFTALWAVIQFVSLLLTSIIESLQSLDQLYVSADPFVKFLVLAGIGFVVWLIVRRMRR